MALDNENTTASSRQDQETENWFDNPSLEGVGNNMAHILAVNSGNEGVREALGEEIAASNSGRAGKDVNYLARNIDKSQQARDNSVADEMKSADLSAGQRIKSGVDDPDLLLSDEEIDLPVMQDESDMSPVVAAIYMCLLPCGISQGQLNEAMAKGGPDDDRATLNVFHDMAEGANSPELAEYVKNADEFAYHLQVEGGMKNADKPIGTEQEVTETVVTPEHELVAAAAPELEDVALQGPVGPTEMKPV